MTGKEDGSSGLTKINPRMTGKEEDKAKDDEKER